MQLDTKMKAIISKEVHKKLDAKNKDSREQILRVKEKYDELKSRGLIQDDTYGINTIERNTFNQSIYAVN